MSRRKLTRVTQAWRQVRPCASRRGGAGGTPRVAAGLIIAGLLALVAGGCANKDVRPIVYQDNSEPLVLKSDMLGVKTLDEAVDGQAVAPAPAISSSDLAVAAAGQRESMVLAKPIRETIHSGLPREAAAARTSTATNPPYPSNLATPMSVNQAVSPTLASKPALDNPADDTEFVLPLAKVRS